MSTLPDNSEPRCNSFLCQFFQLFNRTMQNK
jgi:hypothetical protein